MSTESMGGRPSVYIDTFSGAIGDMKRKDQADRMKVLAVLAKSPRFSVFDATDNQTIARSLEWLRRGGLITIDNSRGFPWSDAVLTESGRAMLAGAQP